MLATCRAMMAQSYIILPVECCSSQVAGQWNSQLEKLVRATHHHRQLSARYNWQALDLSVPPPVSRESHLYSKAVGDGCGCWLTDSRYQLLLSAPRWDRWCSERDPQWDVFAGFWVCNGYSAKNDHRDLDGYAFSQAGPSPWNSLKDHLRSSDLSIINSSARWRRFLFEQNDTSNALETFWYTGGVHVLLTYFLDVYAEIFLSHSSGSRVTQLCDRRKVSKTVNRLVYIALFYL